MNIIDLKQYDVINGLGVRTSIWFAGCSNHCEGCWSPNTWNPNQGKALKDCLPRIEEYLKDKKTDGVSILGGDPLYSIFSGTGASELIQLLKLCKSYNKNIWLWTGYTLDKIVEKCPEVLGYIDVLIDGRYIKEKKDLNLYFRGSRNQRIIFFDKPKENYKFKYYVATYVNDISIGGPHYLITEYNKESLL